MLVKNREVQFMHSTAIVSPSSEESKPEIICNIFHRWQLPAKRFLNL